MPYLTMQDETKIYYEERGKGQPIVFLHGLNAPHLVNREFVKQFTDEYRCITFEKDNVIIFVWITKSAYNDYKTGLRTLDEIYWNEVKAESIISKTE